MRNYSKELRDIKFKEFEPIGFVEQYTADYTEDKLYLFAKFDNKKCIIEFQEINDNGDVELYLLSFLDNSFIDIDTHTINFNDDFEYDFYKYNGLKIDFNEFFNVEWKLSCISINKTEFLKLVEYKDKFQEENQEWTNLIEEFKKLNYTPSEIRKKILTKN